MISGTHDVAGCSVTQNPQLFEVIIWSCDRICDAFTSSMQHVTFRHMISRCWWWEYHHPLLLDFFPQFCNHPKYLEISTFSWIFWISHESCISSGCFRTVQMVVLRLKVFSCELSTTRIMSVFELVYLQNPLQMTSNRFWLPANCETRVLMALRQHFLQMVLGQLGQGACRNHDKFHVRQQWRCSWNQRGRTSWRWWSHVQKVIWSQVNVCFETVNWECPPGASYFSSCYPLLLEKTNKK